MNKTSYFFIAIGILILIGVVVIVQKPSSKQLVPKNPSSPAQPAQPLELNFSSKKGGSAAPKSYSVTEGQKVVVKITSDIADEAHFHGYDLQKSLEASQVGIIEFTADKTGRFELELENSKITLGFIEVYPASGTKQRQ